MEATARHGFAPIGTATVKASVYGTGVTFGPDGYVDLVDVQVTQAQNELMYLEVNTTKRDGQNKKSIRKDVPHRRVHDRALGGPTETTTITDRRCGRLCCMAKRSVGQHRRPAHRANDRVGVPISAQRPTRSIPRLDSLQEQNPADFPAGNGTGNGWEQDGGSRSPYWVSHFSLAIVPWTSGDAS